MLMGIQWRDCIVTLIDLVGIRSQARAAIASTQMRKLHHTLLDQVQTDTYSFDGLTVTNRIRTATEEIDISILNDSEDPRLRRESALLLAECKNWMGKCGKDEFVIFREKIENRNQRCNLGFLISWNGFATTVTKEMLRGSREQTLIVPVTGKDLRAAVRDSDFLKVLVECWDKAVHL